MRITESYQFNNNPAATSFKERLEKNRDFFYKLIDTERDYVITVAFLLEDTKLPYRKIELIRAFATYYTGVIHESNSSP